MWCCLSPLQSQGVNRGEKTRGRRKGGGVYAAPTGGSSEGLSSKGLSSVLRKGHGRNDREGEHQLTRKTLALENRRGTLKRWRLSVIPEIVNTAWGPRKAH